MGLADFCELLLCSVCSLKVGPVFTSLSDTPHVSMWLLGCLVSQRLTLCVGYHVGHRLAGCQQFLKSTARNSMCFTLESKVVVSVWSAHKLISLRAAGILCL